MGAFTQSFAQSGNSCVNPINIGTLSKDTVINISFNYPDTVKWLSFESNSSLVSFLALSNKDINGYIKIKELNLFQTSCTPLTSNQVLNYPGEMAQIIKKQSININQTYKLKLTRYYDPSLNDTNNRNVLLYLKTQSSIQCLEGNCNNIVTDGSFEAIYPPLTVGVLLQDLNCWIAADEAPIYFNINYSDPDYHVPNQEFFDLGINLNPETPDQFFPDPNTGYVGIETQTGNSDILQGSCNYLLPNKKYFASYLVSPGKTYSLYHDKIDLQVVDPSVIPTYHPSFFTTTPHVESGIVGFNLPWTRVSNVFTSSLTGGENYVYVGNLSHAQYSNVNTIIQDQAYNYYIDNLIIKPFELELGSDIVACEGQIVDLNIPCQYLYPGATYTWASNQPGFTNPATADLSFTAIGNYWYELAITVTNPQGGFETVTDVINLTTSQPPNIGMQIMGGPQGMYCENNGVLYIVIGNQVNLQGNGAGPSGTYNWYVNGNLSATNQLNFNIPGINTSLLPNITYQVTVEGNDGTCIGDTTLNFELVASRCQLPCNAVLGQSFFINSANYLPNDLHLYPNTSSANFGTLQTVGQLGQNLTYVVDGTFTININTILQLENVTILVSPGGKIVNNGALLLNNCVVDACEQMWDRIDNYGSLVVFNNSVLRHAEAAIELRANSETKIGNSTFTDNVVGVFSRKLVNSNNQKVLSNFSVIGTTFQGNGTMPQTMRFTSQYSQYTGLTGSSPTQQPEFYLRPANGINIRAVSTISIGSINSAANKFSNMWNGIVFDNSAGIITNCQFDGMEANVSHAQLNTTNHPQSNLILNNLNPNYSTHYKDIVTNAISNINKSYMVVESVINDDGNNPTINNCFRGISNLGSDIRTAGALTPNLNGDYLFIRNVSTGARTEGAGNLMVVDFHLLDIEAFVSGIVANNQNGGSLTRIRFNNIFMSRLPGTTGQIWGIQQRQPFTNNQSWSSLYNSIDYTQVVDITSPNVNVQILNNTLVCNTATTGVEIFAGTNTQIRDNYIEMQLNNTYNAALGVDLRNCFNTNASCNFITSSGLAPTAQTDASRAIRVESSQNCDVTCNQTSNYSRGFYLNFISHGSNYEGNEFGSHKVGLLYDSWAEAGIQADKGNKFVGPFSSFGASSFMQAFVVPDNEYRVNLNTVFDPITISGSLNWFQPSNNNAFQCSQNGFNCNFFNPNAIVVNPNVNENGLIELSARGLDSSEFAEEKVWMTKNYVAKVLDLNDSLITNNDSLSNFHDNIANTPMQALNSLMDNISLAQLGTASQLEILNATIIEKDSIFNAWLTAIQINDSASALQLAYQLLTLNDAVNAVRMAIQNEAMNSQVALLAELNTIVAENNLEHYLIEMLSIYLNSVFINDNIALNNSASALANMAYQCPMAAGPAVYWARGMYLIINSEAQFNDEQICRVESNQRIEVKKNKINATNYQLQTLVYPNPTQNIINILTKNGVVTSISVTNSIGNQILNNISFQKNVSPFQIDLSHLPAGFYFLEMYYNNGKSDKRKITIIK